MGNLVKTLRLDLLEFKSYSTKYWRWWKGKILVLVTEKGQGGQG